jgi:hypothetical protein
MVVCAVAKVTYTLQKGGLSAIGMHYVMWTATPALRLLKHE